MLKNLPIRLKLASMYVNMAVFTLPALILSHIHMQKLNALEPGAGDSIVRAFAIGYPVFVLVYFLVTLKLGRKLTSLIAFPLQDLGKSARQIALGDIDTNLDYRAADEVGSLFEAFQEVADSIRQQADILSEAADGNFTVSIPVRSGQDVMNTAINTLIEKNNASMGELKSASDRVFGAAGQISGAAETLANGTSEQSATVEQLNAAATEILRIAEDNMREAEAALQDNQQAGALVKTSTESIDRMLQSMKTIEESSQQITKVIKVIDDIAFQTNILALNAAVEAARAGQHGKGFAVVADEVRNLASKSAEAAKETSSLIGASSQNVREGNSIALQVNEGIRSVAEIAGRNAASIELINDASRRQSASMAELVSGIGGISSIVQSNAATAQETSAASQQMSGEATHLGQIVSRYRLRSQSARPVPPQVPQTSQIPEASPAGEYGIAVKY